MGDDERLLAKVQMNKVTAAQDIRTPRQLSTNSSVQHSVTTAKNKCQVVERRPKAEPRECCKDEKQTTLDKHAHTHTPANEYRFPFMPWLCAVGLMLYGTRPQPAPAIKTVLPIVVSTTTDPTQ